MNVATTRPYTVPRAGGNGRAIALAVVVHALLAVLLFFGVRWQSSTPATVQAELWSALPQTAAPAPRPVVVQPPVKVESPPEVKVEAPQPKADIVERTAKVEPRKPPPKVDAPKVEPPKKVEAAKPPPPKPVEAPVRPPSDLANLLAQANGPSTSQGKDAQTSGPRGSDTYVNRLVTAIRSQMRYPATAPGNPFVELRIEQLPNGEVVDVTVVRSSGIAAFDDAVVRAVRAASPLPRDEHGHVERVLTPKYNMYEKQ